MNGYSPLSLEGNGAVIITSPDAPVNLAEDGAARTKSSLGLTWEDPVFNGGTQIIDYQVSIAPLGGSFSVVATGLTNRQYTAIGLDFGAIYEFKVEARNSYSYSALSSPLQLYCAHIAEPPLVVTTQNLNDQVVINWELPVENGSPATGYNVFLQTKAGDFVQESTQCQTSGSTVRTCQISLLTLTSDPYLLVQGD